MSQENTEKNNVSNTLNGNTSKVEQDQPITSSPVSPVSPVLEKVKEDQKTETPVVQPKKIDYESKYFYLAAEMENLKKRFTREQSELIKYSNEKILSDLLTVIDNLDRTIEAVQDENDKKIVNIKTGVEMVKNHFLKSLEQYGLKKIETIGKEFDPKYHEAISREENNDHENDHISREFQAGYMLNQRLLRAAKVMITKNKNKNKNKNNDNDNDNDKKKIK